MNKMLKEIKNWIKAIVMITLAILGTTLVLSEVLNDNITKLLIIKLIGFGMIFLSVIIYNKNFKEL